MDKQYSVKHNPEKMPRPAASSSQDTFKAKWETQQKFEDFLKTKFPDLAKKRHDVATQAAAYGETIHAPPVPTLTGNEAQDSKIAQDYVAAWLKAASERQPRPSGLGT